MKRRPDEERGSVLVLFVLWVPVMLLMLAFVVDTSTWFVQRRQVQGAADAGALAAAQLLPSTTYADVKSMAEDYVGKNVNGATTTVTWPYKGSNGKLAVKVDTTIPTIFAGIAGLFDVDVSARSVAGIQTVHTDAVCNPGTPPPGYVPPPGLGQCGDPATSQCVAGAPGAAEQPCDITVDDPGTVGAMKAIAFAKSSDCGANNAAIQWTGTATSLGGLATNGGIEAAGSTPKQAKYLALGRKGEANCELGIGSILFLGQRNASSECGFGAGYNGAQCFELLKGRRGSDGLCRIDGSGSQCPAPIEYPVTPPSVPSIGSGCRSTDTANINSEAWKTGHPPGVYCLPPSLGRTLTIGANNADFSGYTFFAPSIGISSNSMTFTPAAGAPAQTTLDAYGAGSPEVGGPRFTGHAANFNDGGSVAWQKLGDAQGNTNNAAYAIPGSQNATTQRLRASQFGLNVPADAMINGILVEVERDASAANSFRDSSIKILKAGVETGIDEASPASWPTAFSYASYGGPTDLWGQTWTPADINGNGFGVSIKGLRTAATVAANCNGIAGALMCVRRVRITVYYTVPEGLTITGGNNTIQGNIFAPDGTITIAGGGASTGGGEGFMESLKLKISGNFETYKGSGPLIGGTGGGTHTETGHVVSQPATGWWTPASDSLECCGLDE